MIEQIARLIEIQQGCDEKAAYIAGFDCAKNGATQKNCHFKYFSRQSMTTAWERGKRDGEKLPEPPEE